MSHVILLLDSNYLTSAKHAPKKWNVNYISVAGLSNDERFLWESEYGEDWSSVDSELPKELAVISGMLNTLAGFGYKLITSMTSNPRVAYKDTENNRECYIWTLFKSSQAPDNSFIDHGHQRLVSPNSDFQAPSCSTSQISSHFHCCKSNVKVESEGIKHASTEQRGLTVSKEIENAFINMSAKERKLRSISLDNKRPLLRRDTEESQVMELNVRVSEISEI